ncbi:MAG: LysR family transcriptional regulator [Lachnospiraceae bacterium]|nr:LysR family transcriptional regulator [Lachnospiraceae bacterium]
MFSGMKYVYAVYKERSFSKAAETLYISQPALSAMIKKVEAKVGMELFDRTTSPIRLTECGKRYIETAERIMDLENEFACYVGDINELRTGELSVGGSYLFSAFVLPPIIMEFSRKYPHVNVNLFEGHTSQLEEKLFQGELDLIIDNYLLEDSIYQKYVFMEEHLILAVPRSFSENRLVEACQLTAEDIKNNRHLDPEHPAVSLKVFANEPFVLLRLHNDTRKRVESICARAGVKLNVTMMLNQLLTTYHLTGFGMGASVISDTVIKSQAVDPEIVYYKIDDPEAVRQVYLYHRKSKFLTRSMMEFMKIALPGVFDAGRS